MTNKFIIDINDFEDVSVCEKIVDTIKKTFDKEDRFKLYIYGFAETPEQAVDVCDKGSNDLSYKGLIDHITHLHIVYQKCKEDN